VTYARPDQSIFNSRHLLGVVGAMSRAGGANQHSFCISGKAIMGKCTYEQI
jgi:hypothetical protein